MPTVTVRRARPGRRSIEVDGITFPLGEPVRDVPEKTLERLRDMPGVVLHVSPGARKKDDDPDEQED